MNEEVIGGWLVFTCILAAILTAKGCSKQDNDYQLEKLRIERQCPEVKK